MYEHVLEEDEQLFLHNLASDVPDGQSAKDCWGEYIGGVTNWEINWRIPEDSCLHALIGPRLEGVSTGFLPYLNVVALLG